tara:strand:+ start:327 stop:461 length:135 start_codon:yes stop_codon:yes gene_type:complete
MNKKMPNKFIAREKPQVESKFVPFTTENFPNKEYNKKSERKNAK